MIQIDATFAYEEAARICECGCCTVSFVALYRNGQRIVDVDGQGIEYRSVNDVRQVALEWDDAEHRPLTSWTDDALRKRLRLYELVG